MRLRLALLVVPGLLIAACAARPSAQAHTPFATQTPDPAQLYADAGSSQSTAQAANLTAQFFSGKLTATVEAQQAAVTERAWNLEQTQAAANITSTARAWELTVAADIAQSTATAAEIQTQQAVSLFSTLDAAQATATANFANAQTYATAMAGEAERVQNAVERDRITNLFKAVIPPMMLTLTFAVTLYLLYYHGRIRIVPRDVHGDASLLADVIDGTIADPDRNFHPQGGFRREDVEALSTPTPLLQAQVTERDQMVDLATRGSRERSVAPVQRGMGSLPAQADRKSFVTIVPPQTVQSRLQDIMTPMMLEAVEVEGEILEEKA